MIGMKSWPTLASKLLDLTSTCQGFAHRSNQAIDRAKYNMSVSQSTRGGHKQTANGVQHHANAMHIVDKIAAA